ncbi:MULTISPECIES: acetylornithine deacetylase [unclassified Bosea (in: a-proteobacteria)]|uniref:acetylornithine deacetylase n=1 Tax=unclassified Bosea (in: a-proteobacteria) TaxID=2653178 RepID=UPI000F75534E|nr:MULTISPECIES: acetylornithine deacetylase [unclassified Bosea (in: a-proteobacteria)]AZO81496.1 acetylornithine deacetylase (ArgE) [Bosea sp. Tri-49]RXT27732.1 acetylornithine deacetylase [Bosea sp. Tri-39]RXT36085.1 acetylornithine deacetylase [Bosea sp. Tri-54]
MTVETVLADLVGFPSVCRTPNGAIIEHVRAYLAGHGVDSVIMPGPEGDRANLFATIGPRVEGGVILSAHLDVVPAAPEGWVGDPFKLRRDGERLIGRGAVDMKGFVACMLASVPALVGKKLARPVHIALSYDEEVGCVGVRHLIARLPELCPPVLGCIVGEPSGLRPVLAHKGKIAQRVTVDGKAGHSSRTDLGDNAIHYAASLIAAIHEEALRHAVQGPFAEAFAPPYSTIQVGVIRGGTGINIVPAQCVFEVEARAIAGQEPADLLGFLPGVAERIAREAAATGHKVAFSFETMSDYPPLALDEADPLVAFTEAASGQARQAAVSYGTEAGRFQRAGIAAIVCGPGDVDRAHKPEEYITDAELTGAMAMIAGVADRLS